MNKRPDSDPSPEVLLISRIIDQLKPRIGWCVDVGANNGKTDSNTWDLITRQDWSSVQIEAGQKEFKALNKEYRDNHRVICLNEYVSDKGAKSLDKLLSSTPTPRDFSLLSIDIDGMDYYIWQTLTDYTPQVVIIEFNPTIPDDICFVPECNPDKQQGASLLALTKLAESKGYLLLVATGWNAIFIREQDLDRINRKELFTSPYTARDPNRYTTRLFQLFDGSLVLDGYNQMFWHNRPLSTEQLQLIPESLRGYPPPCLQSPNKISSPQERINAICQNLVLNGRRVAIYGAGKHTAFLFKETLLSKANIACLIDDNEDRHASLLWGHPVKGPEALRDPSIETILLSVPRLQEQLKQTAHAQAPHTEIIAPYNPEEITATERFVANGLKSLQYQAVQNTKIHPEKTYASLTKILNDMGYPESAQSSVPCTQNGSPLPWFTYPCIQYLSQYDLSDKTVFEWGCGNSSLFFAERCLSVRSIECSSEWAKRIRAQAPDNLEIIQRDADAFAEAIEETDEHYDIIIIDAERRLDCANVAVKHLREGGLIIVDNADNSKKTCAAIRKAGFFEVDFHGFGPVCPYQWTTSIFLKSNCALQPSRHQPCDPTGNLARDLDTYRSLSDIETPAPTCSTGHLAPVYKGIVSYAQEGEDILLEKIFCRSHRDKKGFYVDIGAYHPVKWSLTYHFYRKGWKGINIEPRPGSKIAFDDIRPRDINIELAVASEAGTINYHLFEEGAYNTCDPELAELYKKDSRQIGRQQVPVEKLANLLDQHLPKGQGIDLMSIDVEGLELSVLKSNDWHKYRPAVIAIEVLDFNLDPIHGQNEAVDYLLEKQYKLFAKTHNTLLFLDAQLDTRQTLKHLQNRSEDK